MRHQKAADFSRKYKKMFTLFQYSKLLKHVMFKHKCEERIKELPLFCSFFRKKGLFLTFGLYELVSKKSFVFSMHPLDTSNILSVQ
jgi:hypothetical protein